MKTIKILFLFLSLISIVACEKEDPIYLEDTELKYDQNPNSEQFFIPQKCASLKFKLRTEEDQMGAFADNEMVYFKGKVWSIGGYQNGFSYPNQTNAVWYSNNGYNWISTPTNAFQERAGHTLTVFNNKMWLIGGVDGSGNQLSDVWYSNDGLNWRIATNTPEFGAASGHSTTVFKNFLVVLKKNDIWISKNGVQWKKIAKDIFTSRFYGELITFNNTLYAIGGETGTGTYFNEIWKSDDGFNWSQVPTTGPLFSERSRHTTTIYQNKVWLIGGTQASGYDSDEIWVSDDLKSWCKYSGSTPFTNISSHSSLALGDSIWVFGGFASSGITGKIWSFKNF